MAGLPKEFQALQAHIEKAKKEEEFIRHSLEELAEFDTQPDEEAPFTANVTVAKRR